MMRPSRGDGLSTVDTAESERGEPDQAVAAGGLGVTRARTLLAVACVVALGAVLVVVATMLPADAPPPQPEPQPRAAATVEDNDIHYGIATNASGLSQNLQLDLIRPSEEGEARPAVVLVHGGGFKGGSRKLAAVRQLGHRLAEAGYVVAAPEYRSDSTSPRFTSMAWSQAARDAQHDVQAAVRYLRRYAGRLGVDRDRIAVAGMSSGGITALRVAYNPEDPGRSGSRGYSSEVQAAMSMWGGLPKGEVEGDRPPVLMFHGMEDRKLEPWLSRQACWRAREHGNFCWGVWWDDTGHAPEERVPEIVEKTLLFLSRNL